MTRYHLGLSVVLWAGASLLLSALRPVRRPCLADRVGAHLPGGARSVPDRLRPFPSSPTALVRRLAAAGGGGGSVGLWLDRTQSPLDVTGFRMRQIGWACAGLVIVAPVALVAPPAAAVAAIVLGPAAGYLAPEFRLRAAAADWQRQTTLELAVVSEQLAMLLSAGYSLSSAISRLGTRGHGATGQDLARVHRRIRHGLDEINALREWAIRVDVTAVDQLVSVLALNRETGQLGRLISDQARAIRRDTHRELLELIERRGQQVWIPVTVAALVPGVIFLAVPFIEAMRLFAA